MADTKHISAVDLSLTDLFCRTYFEGRGQSEQSVGDVGTVGPRFMVLRRYMGSAFEFKT